MFCGRYDHTIDGKGRISIPSEFREIMTVDNESMFFLTMDFMDKCIVAYPFSQWQELDKQLRPHSVTNNSVKIFLRWHNLMGSKCPIDKQGRILISPTLRNKAGLDKEVVLIGMSNKIEFWDKGIIENAVPNSKDVIDAISKDIQGLNLL